MSLIAQITNPAIAPKLGVAEAGGNTAPILASIIVTLWHTLITLGGLAVLLFIIMGGFGWITAGGDEKKIEESRNRITQAIIGMFILFATIAFVNFIGPAIGIDLLKLQFPNNLVGGG
jgi:hypothetical protein